MLRRALATAFLATVLLPRATAATPAGAPLARQSLALCEQADSRADAERLRLLDQGLALAEEAAAADEADAAAHFAVFCNLGKRMQAGGVSVGSLFAVQRLRREIDLTLGRALLLGRGDCLGRQVACADQ